MKYTKLDASGSKWEKVSTVCQVTLDFYQRYVIKIY